MYVHIMYMYVCIQFHQSPVEVFKGPDGLQLFMRTSSGEVFGPFDQVRS